MPVCDVYYGMGKRAKLDQFDLEAESEGTAIDVARLSRPHKLGKRIAKNRQREARGEGIHENRIQKRHIKE